MDGAMTVCEIKIELCKCAACERYRREAGG